MVPSFFRSIAALFHDKKSSGNDFCLYVFGVILSIRIQDGVNDTHRPTVTDEQKEADQNEDDSDLNVKKVSDTSLCINSSCETAENDNAACVTRWSYVRR